MYGLLSSSSIRRRGLEDWSPLKSVSHLHVVGVTRLICSFERSLIEPVAVRPDDVLEGILIQFLKNLRPALRNLSYVTLSSSPQYHPKMARQAELIKRAETIQNSLSNYINDQLLNSTEFTVWDRAWAANEEVRGGCCNSAEDRMELGRLRYFGEPLNERVAKNPIKKQVEKGGGIFEMDWRDRVKMLRQLVDWQCMPTFPS
jgi:hypothetical protein